MLNYQDTPTGWRRTKAGPLDIWGSIADLTNLATSLPSGIRHTGMKVWVESEEEYYYFKSGITDIDFIPFEAGGSLQLATYTNIINVVEDTPFEVNHNLDASFISCSFLHDGELTLVDWKRGRIDDSEQSNWITITSTIDLTGLELLIIGNVVNNSGTVQANLDSIIQDLLNRTNSVLEDYDTLQEAGDSLVDHETRISTLEQNTTNTVDTEFDTNSSNAVRNLTVANSIVSLENFTSIDNLRYGWNGVLDDFTNLDSELSTYPNTDFFLIFTNTSSNLRLAIRKTRITNLLDSFEMSIRGGESSSFETDAEVYNNSIVKIKSIGYDETNSTSLYDVYELDRIFGSPELFRFSGTSVSNDYSELPFKFNNLKFLIDADSVRKSIEPIGSSYTISSEDSKVIKQINSSNAITVTVDVNSLSSDGDVAEIDHWGTSTLTISAGTGVTLLYNANRLPEADGQYSRIAVQRFSSNVYRVFGELANA